MWYVTIEERGIHVATHKFDSWQTALQYALVFKKAGKDRNVWVGQDGEGAVQI